MVVVVASPPQSQPRGTTAHLGRDMGRESRHVYVSGLPETVSDDRISSFFSSYGRVHQIERTSEGVVVSFMDVRSAQKAHAGDHRLESGIPFKIAFHEPGVKNGIMTTSSMSSISNGTASPKSMPDVSRRRTPSPRAKDGRTALQRMSTNPGKRLNRSEMHRRDQGRSPDSISFCALPPGCSASSTSVCVSAHSSGGLQGVYVERLPPRSDGTVKEAIRDALKKHGRIVDISVEGDGDSRKALVIFQRVIDMEKLVNDSHISILSMRVRIRAASHVVVQEAYNDYLSLNSPAGSGAVVASVVDLPAKYASPNGSRNEVDVFHPKASRTLYVGGLESRISDDTLRRRFGKYGVILDVDVKNYESPSPFAFIQFADIDSAVRAINAHSSNTVHANKKGKKFQPNFGRSMTTNKLWIGSIPPQIGEDYVIQKLRSLSEGVVDVVVDMRVRQAIVVFSSTEGAQAALNRIKAGVPKQFVFKVESGEARVPADFCSDRLHDHFIDRKHGGTPVRTTTSSNICAAGSAYIAVSTPAMEVDDSLTAFLAPPPDPPSDMTSYRYEHHRDQRRSPAHSRRRERSQERPRHRRSSKYDYDKGSSRRKERKDRKLSASSESSVPSSDESSLTRRRSGSNDSRASSPLSYSQRIKDRRRDERREVRCDRNVNGKPRNMSSSRRSPFEMSKWSDRKAVRHSSSASEERVLPGIPSSSATVVVETVTPTADDRKSGDSGFYDDVPRPPLDPPPAPPSMEALSQVPSPPPTDPPVRRKLSPRTNSQSHSTPAFVSPPSSSHHELHSSRHQAHQCGHEPQSISSQHRHHSLSSGPGPSTMVSANLNISSSSQKRHSVDGQPYLARPHPISTSSAKSRTGKWPWNELLRNPCVFLDTANVSLSDPRLSRGEYSRMVSSSLPLPPFWNSDSHPRSVAGEWRKRSSGSAASVDGVQPMSQRRASSSFGIVPSCRSHVTSSDERSNLHAHISVHASTSHHATISRSSSSSGTSGGDSDAQLSPDAAPLPPPPPSALDLLCEPDDMPILADGWSGRLAEIGSRLTDVNASLEEAHRGVAELDEHHHRRPSTSTTETTPTSSRQRQAGVLGITPRTDSFEERLRSINQKKKSSFDDFTLNITQERILAAKASAPDPLSVTSLSGISSGCGLSSSGFSKNATMQRPTLSIAIPQLVGRAQSTSTTNASNRLDSPLSSRKTAGTCISTSASLPTSSALSTSCSNTPIRLAAPPTAPVIAYPPNFSVPPPNFPITPPFIYAPSTTPDSQASPIISAPPPPPQLPPTAQESSTYRDNPVWKSPTVIPGTSSSFKPSATATVTTSSRFPHDASCQQCSPVVHAPHQSVGHGMTGTSQSSSIITTLTAHSPYSTPQTASGTSRTLCYNKGAASSQRAGEKHSQTRHDTMSAVKSPIYCPVSTSSGISLSASDTRKSGATSVAHKDPSTELLAGLFHNKPPTTDFRKLPKIEKKPSATSTHAEKDNANQEQVKKISSTMNHYRKEKEHKLRRNDDGSFETKEERAKRKDSEKTKREREKVRDQKREKKIKEERKKVREEEKEKKERKARKVEKERQREKKPKKHKKKSRASSSDGGSSSDDSDYQRAFTKQLAHLVAEDSGSSCAGTSGGLSMYDRVKRRSSAANKDEGTKKTAALQKLRDKNNEKKNQKRHRIQLDSSDEEEQSHISTQRVIESEADDSYEDENGVIRENKNENVHSSEDDVDLSESRKKCEWSTDESGDCDSGNRKKHRKVIKKTSDKQKHCKNVNMDDVFGADSTDDEKATAMEEKDRKRKKSRKESSDENEAPKKKSIKSDRLDFHSVFGHYKPEKGRKKDKDKKDKKNGADVESNECKKEIAKRKGDVHEIKPAKRQKKCHRSGGSSASEEDLQNTPRKNESSTECVIDEKVDLTITKDEVVVDGKYDDSKIMEAHSLGHHVKCEDDLDEKNMESSQQTTSEARTTPTPASLPVAPLVTEQSRPKLLTKAAMKIFVPSQSTMATSTVSTTQPSTEADSDNSTDYDDVFASAVSESNTGQHCSFAAAHVQVRRTSTSSSAATERDDVSESDSDSQRSRHHAVELVDAAAGYASVCDTSTTNVGDTITFDEKGANENASSQSSVVSSKCKDVELSCCPQPQLEQKAVVSLAVVEVTCTFEQTSANGEAGKATSNISDVQETEDAVKSIFDGDDEEEEPQYPTLVFVPGKNGAVVASAGLTSAGETVLASTIATTKEETSRVVGTIAGVDGEGDASVAPADVSDEQLLRESFVEEPILDEKLAAEKAMEPACSVKECSQTDSSSNVVQTDGDDDIIEVPCPDALEESESACSMSQPHGAHMISPITVAIPDRKTSTPLPSPKMAVSSEYGTFIQPPAMHSLKSPHVPSSTNVSILSNVSPVSGGVNMGAAVVPHGGVHPIYNRFHQPSFTSASVLQQQQTYQQAQTQQRSLSQQQLFQQQLAAQQQMVLQQQQQQQQQILAQQQLEIQQQRERERDREVTFQKERDLQQQRERELHQQLHQQLLQQQQQQQKETGASSRVVKSQAPAAAHSPAPHSATPVNQQAALAAQATFQMQLQQMQMLQMASRDPVGYYQQMSQTFGQTVATALLAQLQAMQQLPTSQAQQYLIELQRQQIKAQQDVSTTASSSPQPTQHERERLVKESQLRAFREREVLHQQQAQSTQQQQAAALYAVQYRLTQQQLLSQQSSAQTSPSISQSSGSVGVGTVSQERKSLLMQAQPHALENSTNALATSSSATMPSPSGVLSSGHSADVAKVGLQSP